CRVLFFFSSRRRHTRFSRDWSSDVCSSDLGGGARGAAHPIAPQDPYALSKHFGEQLMDAAVRRSDLRCVSLRPSWVQHEGNYERNLGPQLRDPYRPNPGLWSYIACTTWRTRSYW